MKTCSYCQEQQPTDRAYCTACGKSLSLAGETSKEEVVNRNAFAALGLLLFFLTLVIFDGVATFLFGGNTTVSLLSIICYAVVLCLSVLALRFEKKKMVNEAQGNVSLIIAQTMMSILMILINLQQLMFRG
ncbi:MAG: hypothetical protein FWE07_08175 [Turicibacter sp.]|nr:hypothetical protein [Turicibacter sp.]